MNRQNKNNRVNLNVETLEVRDTPSTLFGTPDMNMHADIDYSGDVDTFSFRMQAGHTYTLETQLGSLRDSTLTLISSDGSTLAFNDDGGAGLASKIQFTARTSGVYFAKVAAYGSWQTGSYDLEITDHNALSFWTNHVFETVDLMSAPQVSNLGAGARSVMPVPPPSVMPVPPPSVMPVPPPSVMPIPPPNTSMYATIEPVFANAWW